MWFLCIQNMDINIFYLWSGKCNWHWIIYQLTLYRSITHLLQIVNQHFTLLSLIQPHIGAVRAYTPGAIKNINPICQVFKCNWKKQIFRYQICISGFLCLVSFSVINQYNSDDITVQYEYIQNIIKPCSHF